MVEGGGSMSDHVVQEALSAELRDQGEHLPRRQADGMKMPREGLA